ncbi:MAG: PPOX class F420-dependent oxidoreductase, partial [Chloroflexi bacterium]|nr:PPOX class F420-dependent oxidoreductase [Chloroflexota bacterium]
FMSTGTRTGKLATVRADGRPHVVPVWFVMDGDDVIFMTQIDSVKGKNIHRDPRLAISVDEETPPFSFVLIEGSATIMDVTYAEKLRWATQIGGRYMGDALAEVYGERNAHPSEMVVRVTPTKIVALKNLAD